MSVEASSVTVEFVSLLFNSFDFMDGMVSTIETVIASTITVTEKIARQEAAVEVSG